MKLMECAPLRAALHHAAEAGHVEVVAKLVIAGSHVQRMTSTGFTAAHLAARHGFHAVIDKLLLAGYPVDLLGAAIPGSPAASTVLHLAARNGHVQVKAPPPPPPPPARPSHFCGLPGLAI